MLEMRTVNPDEFFQWVWAEARAYGNRLNIDPELLRPHFDLDRSIAVFDQGNVVGGAHSHKLEMSVPGGSAVVAGVANIAVQPTHTRRGILTRMMDHQIKNIYERGEALAALFASESVIYGRYGYGMSSFREQWTIERHHNRYARPYDSPGRILFVDPAEITNDLPDVFLRSTKDRPGVFQKSSHLWEREQRAPEHRQGGQGGVFYIAYEDGGRIDGYARYRTSGNTLTVNELMATTTEANAALWRFCFDLDLVTRTEAERRPVDDPMPWMLADPRQLERTTRDGLWLRLVDVAASLEQRSYVESGRLVLEVRDDLCPWNQGCFELEASPEGVACRPTTASPDFTITVTGLASAYLGAASLTRLSQAGLAEERTSGALHLADRMFATRLAPWTPCGF